MESGRKQRWGIPSAEGPRRESLTEAELTRMVEEIASIEDQEKEGHWPALEKAALASIERQKEQARARPGDCIIGAILGGIGGAFAGLFSWVVVGALLSIIMQLQRDVFTILQPLVRDNMWLVLLAPSFGGMVIGIILGPWLRFGGNASC